MYTTARWFELLQRAWRVAVSVCRGAHRSESLPHAFGLAAACRMWWAPEVKNRASGGHSCNEREGSGSGRRFRAGRRFRVWSPLSRVPRRDRRLTESDRPAGIKPDHSCCGAVSFGLTPAVRPDWLRPPIATRNPGHSALLGKAPWCYNNARLRRMVSPGQWQILSNESIERVGGCRWPAPHQTPASAPD